jgi:hypothetical protein
MANQIEQMWLSYETTLPVGASRFVRSQFRRTFFAGATCLMSFVIQAANGPLRKSDFDQMEEILAEIRDFASESLAKTGEDDGAVYQE